jgi:hypothetical protein
MSLPSLQQDLAIDNVEKSVSEQSNTEGTFHQMGLGLRTKRKHFFSPLDPSYANAVHRDAETVEYSEAEEVRLT